VGVGTRQEPWLATPLNPLDDQRHEVVTTNPGYPEAKNLFVLDHLGAHLG
jgi:hypothetical protein